MNWKDSERESSYPNFRYYTGNYTEEPRRTTDIPRIVVVAAEIRR